MSIRLATERDNEQLIELTRQCPIQAGISLFIDRSPDFFQIYKRMDSESSFVLASEEEGRIVGCLGALFDSYLINAEPFTVASMGDLKMHPDYRKGRFSQKIALSNLERCRALSRWGMSYFAEGNKASIGFSQGRGKLPKGILVSRAVHSSVVPFFALKSSGAYRLRHATQEDIPAMLELYKHHYAFYGLAPVMDEASFRRILSYPGMSISKFRLAEKDAQLVACCATWDQYDFQRFVVLRFDAKSSAIMFAMSALRPLLKMPALPKVGEHLRFAHLCYVAVRDRQVAPLRDLVRAVLCEMRGGQHSFLNVYFDEKDDLRKCLKGTVSSSTRSLLFLFPFEENYDYDQFKLGKPLVHVEYATFV
ncbi:MAG: hypothetical protein MUC50_08660 [Myxococcota bacterium]|jgi:N-acetylglutamate synthase-like GNAT family acetyltransferase|nr:hypothetical protein [Myxococcota bacterium]